MKNCPYCAEEIQNEAIKCKHCAEMLTGPSFGDGAGPAKKLFRSRNDRMLAGVCGGMAEYAGMDPTIVRLLVALVIVFSAILPGLIAYIVMAIVIPEQP
jgi:phage shock protein C